MDGKRLVVLGASAGIGRSFAVEATKAGAALLLCGRRPHGFEETRAEAGSGTVCAVDISTEDGCLALTEAAKRFGAVDAVVCTVGSAPLRRLEDMTISDWVEVMQSNVVAVNSAIRCLLPSVVDSGLVLALSTEAVAQPRWGLGGSAARKAGLETSLAAWRNGVPPHSFRYRLGRMGPPRFGPGGFHGFQRAGRLSDTRT